MYENDIYDYTNFDAMAASRGGQLDYGYEPDAMALYGQMTDGLDNGADLGAIEQRMAMLRQMQQRIEQDGLIRQRMEEDLAAIRRAFPQERAESLEELANSDKVLDYIGRGIEAVDAYKLANFDALMPRGAARYDGADKAHMIPVGGSAGMVSAEPPNDVMELYRRLNPGVSRQEIKKHWNKSREA